MLNASSTFLTSEIRLRSIGLPASSAISISDHCLAVSRALEPNKLIFASGIKAEIKAIILSFVSY